MKEIKGFEDVNVESGLGKGIYTVKVVTVKDIEEKEYLEIKFDVCEGQDAGIFRKLCNNDIFQWSFQGIYRASYKPTAVKFFKQFITAVEKSNTGYVWDWNEQGLIGKVFVAVFDEEEYQKKDSDEIGVSVKLREVRSTEALREGKIKLPGLKKLKVKEKEPEVSQGFSVDQLPF